MAKKPPVEFEVKKPENLDLSKAKAFAEKIIRENKEWLKEMAKK